MPCRRGGATRLWLVLVVSDVWDMAGDFALCHSVQRPSSCPDPSALNYVYRGSAITLQDVRNSGEVDQRMVCGRVWKELRLFVRPCFVLTMVFLDYRERGDEVLLRAG